jgi:ABC-type multidrug transport system fused ATPase/permease subunit
MPSQTEAHSDLFASLNLPQEPPAVIENSRAPAYWPSSSNNDSLVIVENLEVKYAPELPAVLHDISFTLKASERIGLLGRTGWLLLYFMELNILNCSQEVENPRWP